MINAGIIAAVVAAVVGWFLAGYYTGQNKKD